MKTKFIFFLALSCFINLPSYAADWEIKTDLKFTDSPLSDETSYEDNGDFDKRKIKQKRKLKLDTLFTYAEETSISDLSYELRLGHSYERNKKHSIQLREDDSLKKDKSLTEVERITYAGVSAKYKLKQFLGADRWVVKTYYDHYLHVEFDANDLHEDADPISGELKNGYEWSIQANGEYSTPWPNVYILPFVEFKEEYRGRWYNEAENEWQAEEREEQYEAGLYLNWLTSITGLEAIFGPYWQKERKYEREFGDDNWESEDDERWIARFKLEYEAAIPGLEWEIAIQQDLNGEDQGERVYNIELSYEF